MPQAASVSVTSGNIRTFSATGALVFWSLKSADLSVLQPGLISLGMKKYIPNKRTPQKALKLATTKVAKQYFGETSKSPEQRSEIFVVPRKELSLRCYDVYIPEAQVKQHQLPRNLKPVMTTYLKNDSNSVSAPHTPYLVLHEAKHLLNSNDEEIGEMSHNGGGILTKLANEYTKRVSQCDTQQLSNQIVSMLNRELNATCLRDCGGLYWLPELHIQTCRNIAKLIETSAPGSQFIVLTVKRDEDMLRAVKNGISIEIVHALKTLASELDNPKLGKRALKSKQKKVQVLKDKVSIYEELIGGTLKNLEDACDVASNLVAQTELTQLGM